MGKKEIQFLEFKITYEVDKIISNFSRVSYPKLDNFIMFGEWGRFRILEDLFSWDSLRIEIVGNGTEFTELEKDRIKTVLYKYICLCTLNNTDKSMPMKVLQNIYFMKDYKKAELDTKHYFKSILEHVQNTLSNSNSNSSIYIIKEKTKQPNTHTLETHKTVVYTVSLAEMSKIKKSQRDLTDLFVKETNCRIDHTFFNTNSIFQIENNNIDEYELFDLKSLYEQKFFCGTRPIDYGFALTKTCADIIEKLATYKNYQTIDDLVDLFDKDGIILNRGVVKSIMSINRNKFGVILERKIATHCARLLLMINILDIEVECFSCNYFFNTRYIYTVEDVCKLRDYIYKILKKIEENLIVCNSPEKYKNLSQEEVEKKAKKYEEEKESINMATKCLETWMIKEKYLKKLDSFQKDYIIEKLRADDIIKCPWDYNIRLYMADKLNRLGVDSWLDTNNLIAEFFFFITIYVLFILAIIFISIFVPLNR